VSFSFKFERSSYKFTNMEDAFTSYWRCSSSSTIHICYSVSCCSDSTSAQDAIARVWRPPHATNLAHHRPRAPLPRIFGGGRFIGTSIGCPVVTFLLYPSRPWSPRPNWKRKTDFQLIENKTTLMHDFYQSCWKACSYAQSSHRKHSPITCTRYRMSAPTGYLNKMTQLLDMAPEISGMLLMQLFDTCQRELASKHFNQGGNSEFNRAAKGIRILVCDCTWTISSPTRSWTFWGTILLLLSLSPNPSLPCSPLPHPYTWKKCKEMNWFVACIEMITHLTLYWYLYQEAPIV